MNTQNNSLTPQRGRRCKLTPDLRARLIALVAKGVPLSHACHAVKICYQSFLNYQSRFPDFREELEEAVATAIDKRLQIVTEAAEKGDVKAAQWLLEHLHPQHFAKSRIEVTGADGQPLAGAVAIYLPQKDGSAPSKVITTDIDIEHEDAA